MATAKYTDAQMTAFSQIAYMKDLSNAFQAQYTGQPIRLNDLLTDAERDSLREVGFEPDDYANWELVDVYDTNDSTGFYCCTIKTGENQAAVAFRGSECGNLGDFVNDWGRADLGLLNSIQTTQQLEVCNFLSDRKDLLAQYDLAMTGHSLGGNLADYATIVSGDYGLSNNIHQCLSLDGPGLSSECLIANAGKISQMSSKMEHVRWSVVGNLLNPIPGVKQRIGDVRNVSADDQYNIGTRHCLRYLKFNKDGSIAKGSTDWLSNIVGPISRGFEIATFSPYTLIENGVRNLANRTVRGVRSLAKRIAAGYKKLISGPVDHYSAGQVNRIDFSKMRRFPSIGGGGSSGGANVIKVSTEDMAKTVSRYMAEKQKLMDAVQICNNAAKTLAQSWAGPSFLAMSIKLADTYKNLVQSMTVIDDAISELRKTIEIMDRTEKKIKASAAALDIGTSPFA